MTTFSQLLIKLNACDESIVWAGDRTIEEVVNDCHRGDWLLWLAKYIEIDHRKLTLAKAHCANTVRGLMKDQRSIKAVDTAIAYGEGKATEKKLRNAADVSAAAAYASAAAADAAAYASAANVSAAAAAYAAAYSAAAYSAYAYAGAKKENRQQTADICRKYIGQDIIDKVNELLK